ncbi:unnamed protein product [Scytosiphon promiscuus]
MVPSAGSGGYECSFCVGARSGGHVGFATLAAAARRPLQVPPQARLSARSSTPVASSRGMVMLASPMADTADASGSAGGSASSSTSRLEEARVLVRLRRQEAKDRAAAAAAAAAAVAATEAQPAAEGPAITKSIAGQSNGPAGGRQRPASTAATGFRAAASRSRSPSPDVDVSERGLKSQSRFRTSGMRTGSNESTAGGRAARGYSPRARPGPTSRGFKGAAGRGGGGGRALAGGIGVKRRRVLPDFTKVADTGAPAPDIGPVDGEENEALVATIRATLQQTIAEVDGRKYAAPSTAAAASGALPSSSTRQGWLRVVGLIRRACGGDEPGDRQEQPESRPPPPPRVAFEMALQVCALCERPDAALEVLSLMRSTGLQANLEAYKARVLKGCNVNRKQGRALFTVQIMTAVQEAGLVADIEMLSAAMDACSKARDTEGAMHFMDQATRLGLKPDDNMYREAIFAFSLAGKWLEARDLALQWREQARTASPPAPAGGGDVADVGLGITISRPPPPPAACNTAILKAMGKAGKVDEALSWLEDTFDAAATAAAAVADSPGESGSKKNREGQGDSVPVCLDHSSFMAVLSACSKAGKWESARFVLLEMDRAGVTPETVAFNTVLAAFEHRPHPGNSGGVGVAKKDTPRWPMALELLADMERRGVEPDVVTYNSLINVLRWGGQREKALAIVEDMNTKGADGGVRPDVITYNSAIAACASGGEWKKAGQLIDEMRRKGLKPDRYSYTSAIHACSKAGNPLEALRLLRAMDANNVTPDVIAMTACMDALAAGGKWSEAIMILDQMRSKGVTPNERTYKAAIQACGRGGQWQRALELLSRLENRASGATVQEYNCAMMACVTGGEPGRALDLLEQMKANKGGVNAGPDMVTYTSAIMACSSTGKWDRALSLLEEMREAGPRTQPNVRSYTAAIAACGRARKWEEAVALHSKLMEDGLSPDPASFNAVIRAARRGGQHKLSMKLLASMVESGLSPDAVTTGELISSLSDRGRWDEAQRVVQIAEKTGAIPPSSLDSDFEVDVSHLPSAIAKVKVRSTLQNILAIWKKRGEARGDEKTFGPLEDLVFVTGMGSVTKPSPPPAPAAVSWAGGKINEGVAESDLGDKEVVIDITDANDVPTTTSTAANEQATAAAVAKDPGGRGGWRVARYSDRSFGLGKVLVEHLRTAFEPPLRAQQGEFVAGCLVVKAADLEAWAAKRHRKKDLLSRDHHPAARDGFICPHLIRITTRSLCRPCRTSRAGNRWQGLARRPPPQLLLPRVVPLLLGPSPPSGHASEDVTRANGNEAHPCRPSVNPGFGVLGRPCR